MKNLLIAFALITGAGSSYAEEQTNTLNVGKEMVTLTETDFRPIVMSWANREVVTGYEALIDITDTESSLIFNANGEISARWFASNFAMTTKLSCNGIPIGMSKVYGQRKAGQSIPAKPAITELRHNLDGCEQLKVELFKEGSLSRQFYTRIQSISLSISVQALDITQGEI